MRINTIKTDGGVKVTVDDDGDLLITDNDGTEILILKTDIDDLCEAINALDFDVEGDD